MLIAFWIHAYIISTKWWPQMLIGVVRRACNLTFAVISFLCIFIFQLWHEAGRYVECPVALGICSNARNIFTCGTKWFATNRTRCLLPCSASALAGSPMDEARLTVLRSNKAGLEIGERLSGSNKKAYRPCSRVFVELY